MDEFKSVIATELCEYLSIRQMTLERRTCKIDHYVLGGFDSYLAEHGAVEKTVTEKLVNGWIHLLRAQNHSRTVNNKVSCLRCFLKYLRYCGVPVFMPHCPKYHEDYVPYIFFRHGDEKDIFSGRIKWFPAITAGEILKSQC